MRLEEKKNRRFSAEKIYMYCFVIWSVLNMIFTYSTLSKKLGLPLSTYVLYVDLLVIVLLFVKILIGNVVYTQKQLIISVLLIITGLLVYFATGSRSMFMLVLFIISSKDISIDRVLLLLFKVELITVGLIIILSLLNVIPNKVSLGTYTVEQRYCLGFLHPNQCGFALINIVLLDFYLHRKRLVWYDFALLLVALFVDYRWPKSKTTYYVLIFAFVACLFLKVSSYSVKRLFIRLLRFIPFAIIAFTIVIVVLYNNNSAFSSTVNELFTQRISQMSYYLGKYFPKLFGQHMEIVSSSQANSISEMHALDNAYLNCLLEYGIVITSFFIIGYVNLLKQSIIVKDYNKLVLLITILIWGFSETAMIKLECNSLLILFAGCLYGESETKKGTGLVYDKCQA